MLKISECYADYDVKLKIEVTNNAFNCTKMRKQNFYNSIDRIDLRAV